MPTPRLPEAGPEDDGTVAAEAPPPDSREGEAPIGSVTEEHHRDAALVRDLVTVTSEQFVAVGVGPEGVDPPIDASVLDFSLAAREAFILANGDLYALPPFLQVADPDEITPLPPSDAIDTIAAAAADAVARCAVTPDPDHPLIANISFNV